MAELDIARERTSVDDRLLVMLLLAGLFHLIIILGISFSAATHDSNAAPQSLEVLLVNDSLPTSTRNDDARYLSQRTQKGAGNVRDSGRSEMPSPGNAPVDQPGSPRTSDSQQELQGPDAAQRETLITSSLTDNGLAQGRPEPVTAADPDAPQQLLAGTDSTLPSAEDDPELRLKGAAKRELMVTPSTRESGVAVYLDAWRHKVERIGTINFPNQARRQGMTGNPVVEVVLGSDGKLLDAIVRRSSGYPELDQAALQILRLAAPFAPFPRQLAERHDALRFAYEWQFVGGQLRGSTVRVPAGQR